MYNKPFPWEISKNCKKIIFGTRESKWGVAVAVSHFEHCLKGLRIKHVASDEWGYNVKSAVKIHCPFWHVTEPTVMINLNLILSSDCLRISLSSCVSLFLFNTFKWSLQLFSPSERCVVEEVAVNTYIPKQAFSLRFKSSCV